MLDKAMDVIRQAAPMVAGLLIANTGVGAPFAGAVSAMVANALGTDNNEQAIAHAVTHDPEAAQKLAALEVEKKYELERMYVDLSRVQIQETNQTMRTELNNQDSFVSRWRPTFGYQIAYAWAAMIYGMIALTGISLLLEIGSTYTGVKAGTTTAVVKALAELVGAMAPLWVVALSVLGINIKQRSNDKQVQAGLKPVSLFESLGTLIRRH